MSHPPPRNPEHHPLVLLTASSPTSPLLISAPMVRYSKLPFRTLVRHYHTSLCYTPMILAKEFTRSPRARFHDFTTTSTDGPLVVQFAALDATSFARATELVAPYCDGVNLNCGCPQTWAIAEGVGCALMEAPEVVAEMVRAAKKAGEGVRTGFCVSVKIRVHKDLRKTERWVRIVESAGVDYIIVHGRTRSTKSSQPVDLRAIAHIADFAKVPVVANGDVFSLEDAHRIAKETGVVGVMAARGLLENPALYTGAQKCPWGAIERFLLEVVECGLKFPLVVYHVGEMLGAHVSRKERGRILGGVGDLVELVERLDRWFVLRRPGEEGFGETVDAERRVVEIEGS